MIDLKYESSLTSGNISYLLLYKDLSINPNINQAKAKAVVDFISWAATSGQTFPAKLNYVPLPTTVVKNVQDTLKTMTFKGASLYTGP